MRHVDTFRLTYHYGFRRLGLVLMLAAVTTAIMTVFVMVSVALMMLMMALVTVSVAMVGGVAMVGVVFIMSVVFVPVRIAVRMMLANLLHNLSIYYDLIHPCTLTFLCRRRPDDFGNDFLMRRFACRRTNSRGLLDYLTSLFRYFLL
jgi:hypothetical protein